MTSVLHPLLDRHIERRRGGEIAVRTPAASYTYVELRHLVTRAGNALRGLGVEPEQRVALLLPDSIELVAAFLGAIEIGAVAVPLNTRLAAPELAAILGDCRAKVLVADGALLPALEAALHAPPRLRILASGEFATLLGSASARPAEAAGGLDDMAFWLYTSGTTGTPKGVMHSRRTLLAGEPYASEVLGATERDRFFITSKLFFAYAVGYGLIAPLTVGAQMFLHPSWADPETVVTVLRDFAPTLFFSVPTLYARLVRSDLRRDDFASVRLCLSAGERLPAELFQAFWQRFGVPIVDAIGATETVHLFLSNRPGRIRPGSSGFEAPGVLARILDEEGREVPPGERGVLWVKTPSNAIGYWNRLDLTRATFVGEWYRTRDVYSRDADGYYWHHGREDDFFKVAAQWVDPSALERALLAHPAVLEAAVIGAENEVGLTKPIAFVVPKEQPHDAGTLGRELEAFVAERLAPHERPRRVAVVTELPRTATGKLQRFRLRERGRELLREADAISR